MPNLSLGDFIVIFCAPAFIRMIYGFIWKFEDVQDKIFDLETFQLQRTLGVTGLGATLLLYLAIDNILSNDQLTIQQVCGRRGLCLSAYNLSWTLLLTLGGLLSLIVAIHYLVEIIKRKGH